jgi:serine/threonine protein kinase
MKNLYVKILEIFKEGRAYFLDFVLELCEGGNLLKYKEKIKREEILKLFKQLISSVEYLHSKNILHRDIKPENILITGEGDLKLADFGSAFALCLNNKSDSDLLKDESELNKFVGTPEYLAPEILKGAVKLDETVFALDWWAVGCTFYWILTSGKVLFEAGTEYLVYKSIESGPSASSLRECCDLDGTLGEIIFGLLERDPKRRIKFVMEQLKSLLE